MKINLSMFAHLLRCTTPLQKSIQTGILTLILFLHPIQATAESVWDVLRQQFKLNHEITRPEVQRQLHWLISHPNYLHQLAQSEPYIYHIVTEIRKRHMPGEIALIPMIESAYNPFAYSIKGAAGLWQFMPGTGVDYGLKQDWWFDARRSIGPSTTAALNYFLYLHQYFGGNWILAIAAYDCGEGAISRTLQSTHQSVKDMAFWSLPLPGETKNYVPRLLALAEIIQNPARYHVQLPNIPHQPYFKEIKIANSIDLSHAAKLAGISYHEMLKLNPGFNHWSTKPYRPYRLLIPVDKAEHFSRNLAQLGQGNTWTRHQVSAGDNLQIIAHRYHTTANLIKAFNQLKDTQVKKGQYVIVPKSQKFTQSTKPIAQPKVLHFAAPQQLKMVHIIGRHETYEQISKRYHISLAQLQQWNHLKSTDKAKEGQSLVIWHRVLAKK